MQTASFSGLIETLLYILAFYYIFKFLAQLFLPVLAKKVVEKASEQFQQQNQTTQKEYNTSSSKIVGEYIDYEEIE